MSLNPDLYGLESKIDEIDMRLDGLLGAVGRLSTNVEGISSTSAAISTKVEDLSTKVEDLSTKVEDLSASVEALDERFDSLDARINAHSRETWLLAVLAVVVFWKLR